MTTLGSQVPGAASSVGSVFSLCSLEDQCMNAHCPAGEGQSHTCENYGHSVKS